MKGKHLAHLQKKDENTACSTECFSASSANLSITAFLLLLTTRRLDTLANKKANQPKI